MTSVALIGANGYVGSRLAAALAKQPGHAVTAVTRANYETARTGSYDVLINAAMPAARFKAKNNPAEDFAETVSKTAGLLYGWTYKKFVHISTVSARCQLDTVYGRHKAAAEALIPAGHLIVRLGPMYGPSLKTGVLIDILAGKKVYVNGQSRYCFSPADFCAEWIASNLDRTGIIEVGAKDSLALKDVAKHIGAKIEFEGALDHQEIQNPEKGFPAASGVYEFLEAHRA